MHKGGESRSFIISDFLNWRYWLLRSFLTKPCKANWICCSEDGTGYCWITADLMLGVWYWHWVGHDHQNFSSRLYISAGMLRVISPVVRKCSFILSVDWLNNSKPMDYLFIYYAFYRFIDGLQCLRMYYKKF